MAAAAAAASDEERRDFSVNPVKFEVEYVIKERPDDTANDVVDLFNEESITLAYTATNHDESQIVILGIGGAFRDPNTNEILTNITASSVDPIVFSPGQSQKFSQVINLNLLTGSYILTPNFYVSIDDEFMIIEPRSQLATVSDLPISLFNPKLLFLELVLLASFAGLGYLGYELFGKSYFKKVSSVTKSTEKASYPSAAASTGKAYDSSWLPEGHVKKTKKKN
ncbi:hypothetical protein CANTEDRAFT_129775 [Yamadazyma tenuis ATCC 10573]|nr:uncharacterized protein CANTEDRAFT_129775 [Yamadazyma tenuis ATCC 10573]EGV64537.1 hypothetical protein CANTEDRAFT_129775 [Yamadazyma tenuis ATCC 10573]